MIGIPIMHLVTACLWYKNYEEIQEEDSQAVAKYAKSVNEELPVAYMTRWQLIMTGKLETLRNTMLVVVLVGEFSASSI